MLLYFDALGAGLNFLIEISFTCRLGSTYDICDFLSGKLLLREKGLFPVAVKLPELV